jgi:protocatechuate 3,4-dioxygenase beta subunit
VLDRQGAPVMLSRVAARRTEAGSASGSPVEFLSDTNDLGEYRIGGLPEGAYTVSIVQLGNRPASELPPAEPGLLKVAVRPGDEVPNADFVLDTTPAPPRVASSAPAPVGTGVIRGRVTDPGGRPLAGAVVQAMRPGVAVSQATTDVNGRYDISGLAAGELRVRVSRTGYLAVEYGQQGASLPGRMVTVGPDSPTERVDVVVPRGSAIAGVVVDEYGEPLQDVEVTVLQVRSIAGRPRALRVSGRRTDDRGRYRAFGLLPGTYVVRAEMREGVSGMGTTGYPPIYFPGHSSVEQAARIALTAGVDALDRDIVVRPTAAVRVAGNARSSSGKAATGVLMMISERSGALQVEPTVGRVAEDGSFAFENVPPGDYALQATAPSEPGPNGRPSAGPEFAMQYVTIVDSAPPPLQLRTSRGTTVLGRVWVEGGGDVPTSGLSLQAAPSDFDRALVMGFGSLGFSIEADGAFRFAGLTGPRRLVLGSAPDGWYVKSIVVEGRDVSDAPLDFGLEETTMRGAEIVLSRSGATVAGRVTDDRGTPVDEYTVVVFATDPSRWFSGSRWLKMVRPSQDASFRVQGLPPGEYWTAAVDALEGTAGGGEWQDPEVLRDLSARAARLTIGEGEARQVSLRLLRR